MSVVTDGDVVTPVWDWLPQMAVVLGSAVFAMSVVLLTVVWGVARLREVGRG